MRIAVYSGSFNPLHIGHLAIMEYLTASKKFYCVYLVVSPKNPLKSSISADSGIVRFNAAVAAVNRHPELRVRVDDIELNMAPPHYTIKTLDALRRREPENEFTLIIGADNLSSIHKWRDFPRLLSEYGVAVYPRTGFDLKDIRKQLMDESKRFPAASVLDAADSDSDRLALEDAEGHIYNIQILDAPVVDISSTEIRNGLDRGEDMSRFLM